MARWEAEQQRDYLKEYGALSSSIGRASEQQATKSTAAKYGAMVGAVGLPLAVALALPTGGASLGFWGVTALAGIGSLGGGWAGSKAGGKDIDIETDRAFLKEEAVEAQSIIKEAKKERTEDIWKQAGLDTVTAGFWKGGGADLFKDLGAKGATKLLGEEGAQTLFQNLGFIGTDAPATDFKELLEGTKTSEVMKEINPFKKENWLKEPTKEYISALQNPHVQSDLFSGKKSMFDRLNPRKAIMKSDVKKYVPGFVEPESKGFWGDVPGLDVLGGESMFEKIQGSTAGDWWRTKSKEVSEKPGGWKSIQKRKAMIEESKLAAKEATKGGAYAGGEGFQASAGLPTNVHVTQQDAMNKLVDTRTSEVVKYAKEQGVSYEEAEKAYGITDPSGYYKGEFGLSEVKPTTATTVDPALYEQKFGKKQPGPEVQAMIDTATSKQQNKFATMSDEDIFALTPEQQDEYWEWYLEN